MKAIQYILILSMLLSFGACSDLLGSEEFQAELENLSEDEGFAVQVNGSGTVCGYSEPLYIVDGKVWENGVLSGLEPEKIESIEVLKNTKEWAKYGFSEDVRAVVVITTKKKTKN